MEKFTFNEVSYKYIRFGEVLVKQRDIEMKRFEVCVFKDSLFSSVDVGEVSDKCETRIQGCE